ncbi:MAG: PP2C family protein-serine/threonine phosphatase [Ignavibacteria bacterium]|nr:PP2C family protein-serine/threonine phosphatase [Ignavibacteria bacterium]
MNDIHSKAKQLELNTLIEFSNLINSNLDLNFILNNILLTLMGRMLISKSLLLIKTPNLEKKNEFIIKASKGTTDGTNGSIVEFDLPTESFFTDDIEQPKPQIIIDNNIKYFFKIYFQNKLLGILGLGEKINKQPLSKREIIFIETILNISSTTIENTLKFEEIKKLNLELSNKINKLNSLFELSKEFNTNFLDKSKIINLLSYTLLGNFGIKDLIIISKYRADDYYILSKTPGLKVPDFKNYRIPELKKYQILNKNIEDKFLKIFADSGFELVIPIFSNDTNLESIVFLGKKLNSTPYNEDDISFLEAIMNLSVIALENSILFKDSIEKEILENQLKIARDIQKALLPKEIPQPEGYAIFASNIPALQIGGDYFDILKLTDNLFAIAIADVSGKGTPAALLMANLQSLVRSYLRTDIEKFNLIKATEKINSLICENTESDKFITFFWGILDTKNHTFKYINAGHNPTMVFSENKIIELAKGGLMVGVYDIGFEYEQDELKINPNDIILFYTDGITESQNDKGEEYGLNRLKELVKKNKDKLPSELGDTILNDVKSFTNNSPLFDDQTLIIIKRLI